MHVLWDSTTSLTGVQVLDLSTATGGVGEHFQATAGTSSSGIPTAATCTLINYVIARRYRGGKPRSYFPFGGPGDQATRQTWSATYTTSVTSLLSTYFNSVINQTAGSTTITAHVNVSYYSGFTVVTNPITGRAKNVSKVRTTPLVDNIQSWSVQVHPSSQRRRTRA
jgi:hypothetical protein